MAGCNDTVCRTMHQASKVSEASKACGARKTCVACDASEVSGGVCADEATLMGDVHARGELNNTDKALGGET